MGCHVAGHAGGNLIVVEVWDSKAAQEEFMEKRLGPALQKANAPAPTRIEWFSVMGTCTGRPWPPRDSRIPHHLDNVGGPRRA